MLSSSQAASGRLHAGLPAVQLNQVSVRFGSFTAVQGVDLSIGEGEFVAVVGPTGCRAPAAGDAGARSAGNGGGRKLHRHLAGQYALEREASGKL